MSHLMNAIVDEIWKKEERKFKKELKAKRKARQEALALMSPEEREAARMAWAKEMDAKQMNKGA